MKLETKKKTLTDHGYQNPGLVHWLWDKYGTDNNKTTNTTHYLTRVFDQQNKTKSEGRKEEMKEEGTVSIL